MNRYLTNRKDKCFDSEVVYNFAAAHDGTTISHKSSAAKEDFANNDIPRKKKTSTTEMKHLKERGTGMTNWWLILSVCVFSLDRFLALVIYLFRFFSSKMTEEELTEELKIISAGIGYLTAMVNLGKGVCCISALCVCFGYYTFCFLFGFYQSPSPQQQLLNRYKQPGGAMQWPEWFTLELFFCVDFFVHGILVFIQYFHWSTYAYKSIGAIAGSYFLHRMWSFVYSEYKTIYFKQSELVYGWHSPLPPHVMIIVYSVETLTMGYFLYHLL